MASSIPPHNITKILRTDVGTPSQEVEKTKAPGAWQTVADKIAAIAQENFSGIGTHLNQEYDFKITKVGSHAAQEFEVKVFKKGETKELCTITTSSDTTDAIKFRAKAQDIWDALFNPSFTVSGSSSSSSGALAHAGKAGASVPAGSPLPTAHSGFLGTSSGKVGFEGTGGSSEASLAASGAPLEFGTIEGDLLKRHEAIASLRGIDPSGIPGDLYVRNEGILGTLEREGFFAGITYTNPADSKFYDLPIFQEGLGRFIYGLQAREQTDLSRLEFANRHLDFLLLQDIKVQLEPRSATDPTPRNLRASLVSIDLLQEPIRSQLLNVLGLDPTADYRGMGTSEQEKAIRTALSRFPNPSAQIIPIVNMRMESLRTEVALKATQLIQERTIATLQAREAAILAKIAELTSTPQADPSLDAGLFPVGDPAHEPIQSLASKLRELHDAISAIEARPHFEIAAVPLRGAAAHAEPEAESPLGALQAELEGARLALAGAEATKDVAIQDALRAQEAQHAAALAALTERQEALSGEIGALRGQLTTADARAQAAARAQIEELEARLAALGDPIAQLRAATDEIGRLRPALADSQARLLEITGADGELPRAQAELEVLRRALAAADARVSAARQEAQRQAQATIAALRAKLALEQAKVVSADARAEEASRAQIEELTARLAEAEAAARTAGDEAVAAIRAENARIGIQVEAMQASIAELTAALTPLTEENTALRRELAAQTTRADAATRSADEALRAELEREKAEVRRLEAAIVQADERAQGAEASARASVSEEVAGLRAELEATAARVRELSDATSRAQIAEDEIARLHAEGGPIKRAEKAAIDAARRVQELEAMLAELTRLQQQKALAAIQALTGNLDRTLEGIPEELHGAFSALANFSLTRIKAQQALGALEAARAAGRDSTDLETAFDAALGELQASTRFLAAIDAEKDPQVKALIQYALFSTGSDRMAEAQEARIRALTIELGSTREQLRVAQGTRDGLAETLRVETAAKEEALAANLELRAEVETLTQDKARLAASLQAIALQVGFIEEGASLALDEATLGTLNGHIATRLAGAELEATTAARAAEEASGKSAGLEEALRRAQARLEALSAAEGERDAAMEACRSVIGSGAPFKDLEIDDLEIPEDLKDIGSLLSVGLATCKRLSEELTEAKAQEALAKQEASSAKAELARLQIAQEGAIAAGIARAFDTINASLTPLYAKLTGQELGTITPANLEAQLEKFGRGILSERKIAERIARMGAQETFDAELKAQIIEMCTRMGLSVIPPDLGSALLSPINLSRMFADLGRIVTRHLTTGLEANIAALKAQVASLTEINQKLSKEQARLLLAIQGKDREIAKAQATAVAALERAAAFEANVGEASASAQAATAAKGAAEKRVLAAERALEDARITIGAADAGLATGTAKIRDLTRALEAARSEVASKEQARLAAVSIAGALEHELGRLRAEAGKAGLTQEAFIAENRRLREELAAAQRDAAEAGALAAKKQRLLDEESAEARRVDAAQKAELASISAENVTLRSQLEALRALQAKEAGRASAAASVSAAAADVSLGHLRDFVAKAATHFAKLPNDEFLPIDGGKSSLAYRNLIALARDARGRSEAYRMTTDELYPHMVFIIEALERIANAGVFHARAERTAAALGGGAPSGGKPPGGGLFGGFSFGLGRSSAKVPPPAAEEAPVAASGVGPLLTSKASRAGTGGAPEVAVALRGTTPATALRPLSGGEGTPGPGLTVSALNPLAAARGPAEVSAAGGSHAAPLAARGHFNVSDVVPPYRGLPPPTIGSAALKAPPSAVSPGLEGVAAAGRRVAAALAEERDPLATVSRVRVSGALASGEEEPRVAFGIHAATKKGASHPLTLDPSGLAFTDAATRAAHSAASGHTPGKGGLGGGSTPGRRL